jgi:peptidyl-tRNA hydrolase, PTH2 family
MPIEPNPFNDASLAKIRAEQGDPIVQYFIVRTDLNMSVGKIGAQIAHGAEMFILRYTELKQVLNCLDDKYIRQNERIVGIVDDWLVSSFRKVVLGGKKKDFEKIISELPVFLVRDAGLTEIEPNSETVIVTWPMLKSTQPKYLARLQTLK